MESKWVVKQIKSEKKKCWKILVENDGNKKRHKAWEY